MRFKKSVVQSVVLVSHPNKDLAKKERPPLIRWLTDHSIRVLPFRQFDKADAVITLGGDGTILSIASRAARCGIPVFGINIGRLGFMTSNGLKTLYQGLNDWLSGQWVISERMMLDVHIPKLKKTFQALNDAVLRIGAVTRVTRIRARIGAEDLGSFVGDGVIVATSTGSTAYSLSAQGPVVHPAVDGLLLTPICAHSFSQRPLVFPSSYELTLEVEDQRRRESLQLCLDGQKIFSLNSGDRVVLTGSIHRLKLVQDPSMPYFEVLRQKLLWGAR